MVLVVVLIGVTVTANVMYFRVEAKSAQIQNFPLKKDHANMQQQ